MLFGQIDFYADIKHLMEQIAEDVREQMVFQFRP